MGISQKNVLLFFIILVASSQVMVGARVMKVEKWMKEEKNDHSVFVLPIIQVLQRAPVPPSGRNPCTGIPGQSNGRCTLQTMNVAGHHFVHARPPPIPDSALNVDSTAQSSWCLFDDDGIEPWRGSCDQLHETENSILFIVFYYLFFWLGGIRQEMVATHVCEVIICIHKLKNNSLFVEVEVVRFLIFDTNFICNNLYKKAHPESKILGAVWSCVNLKYSRRRTQNKFAMW